MKVSMKDEIKGNYVIKEYSFEDEAGKAAFWHTAAHVLAQAVKRLYPEAKCAIGPSIKEGFYYDSGHWDHYRENMYSTVIDDMDFAIKPMNCPGGMLVYKMQPHSYRELPIRMGELGLVHRHELSGALHGLMRVRCFTQDDAHIFMTKEQIRDEILGVIQLIEQVYDKFGFKYHLELSTRPEDSIGSDEDWELATEEMKDVAAFIDVLKQEMEE